MVSRVGEHELKQKALVDQTLRMLSFVEKTVSALRTKIEKDQKVPDWLVSRLQAVVMELNMMVPFVTVPKKKFEPSQASKQEGPV